MNTFEYMDEMGAFILYAAQMRGPQGAVRVHVRLCRESKRESRRVILSEVIFIVTVSLPCRLMRVGRASEVCAENVFQGFWP